MKCKKCGADGLPEPATQGTAVEALSCAECGEFNRPDGADIKACFVIYTCPLGDPKTDPPYDDPGIFAVYSKTWEDAVAACETRIPWGSKLHNVIVAEGLCQVVSSGMIHRRGKGKDQLVCPHCGSEEFTPFRDGQDPNWMTCAKCGSDAERSFFLGAAS